VHALQQTSRRSGGSGGILLLVAATIVAAVVVIRFAGPEVPPRAPAAAAAVVAGPAPPATESTRPALPPDDPRILETRRLWAETDSEFGRTAPVTLALEGYSAEGGDLRVFADARGVRKLVARLYGEMGRQHAELFYNDGRLYFLVLTEITYQEPFGPVRDSTEHRFYFQDRQLIRWLDPAKQPVHHTSGSYSEAAARTLEFSDAMYREAINGLRRRQ
jgi:hypothetical protein